MTETPTNELRVELERLVRERTDGKRTLVALERRPCEYRTSFELDELDVELDDGATLRLMFKNLSRDSLSPGAKRAKPEFLHEPMREIVVYRSILSQADLGTPRFYGAAVDPARGRHWLFIENVPGVALWQLGEPATWQETARWLARLHRRFAGADLGSAADHLLGYGADFYASWMRRALDFARRPETDWTKETREAIEWLGERYDPVVERLAREPTTFIHGELYPSNVLIEETSPVRVCPIDWEIAAIGPGLVDLAALTIGRWTDEERTALALAYLAEAGQRGEKDTAEFLETLELFRLHLAVQWLGWEPTWLPPEEHRQDWLAHALRAAEALGL